MHVGFHTLLVADRSSRRIHLILAVLIVVICGAVASVLVSNWNSDNRQASRDTANIAAAITQDILRNVELFDLSIRGAADDMIKPAVLAAPADLRDLILFDRAASASYLGQIIVIGSDGKLIASSTSRTPILRDYGDRDYFRIHAITPDFGLYVSRPLLARTGGQKIIVFSRRISNPDGSFGGVVAGSMQIDYFHQLFRQMKLGPNGSLTLFRSDGSLIMREPYDAALIGGRERASTLFDMEGHAPKGEYWSGAGSDDDTRRLYHYQKVGKLPLIAVAGFALSDIHHDWWWRSLLIGSLVAVSCLLLVMLNLNFARELRSRMKAEAALTALVDTDGLTGLANRRCFDRVIRAEWQRALRQQQPLALLMVDVDHFKAYNDCLGHAAGDAALRDVAACLQTWSRSDNDLVARYGGEEFAVVLPGQERCEALKVAGEIRKAVEHLGLRHPASPFTCLTVSIGLATLDLHANAPVETLCGAADAALYRSKRQGRNTVSEGEMGDPPVRLAS